MKSFLLILVSFASQGNSSPPCYSGNIKIGNDTWTKDDIMAASWPQVTTSVLRVANGDPDLAKFLATRGNCQADCLGVVMPPTLSTLYGKLGEDFVALDQQHIQDMFVEALFGAFRACYPHPPRAEVRKVAEAIVANIGSATSSTDAFPAGVNCSNEGHEDDFPLNNFLKSFESTFSLVVSKNPEMKKFFDTIAKDCQKTCVQSTVPATAMTLFLTNNDDEAAGVDALTGAIHACFPGVPHQDINELVSDTKDLMSRAEAAAEDVEREMDGQANSGWSFFSLCFLAIAVAFGVFGAGVIVSQHLKSGGGRTIETYQLMSTVQGYQPF